jgi:hypothetical protein
MRGCYTLRRFIHPQDVRPPVKARISTSLRGWRSQKRVGFAIV